MQDQLLGIMHEKSVNLLISKQINFELLLFEVMPAAKVQNYISLFTLLENNIGMEEFDPFSIKKSIQKPSNAHLILSNVRIDIWLVWIFDKHIID